MSAPTLERPAAGGISPAVRRVGGTAVLLAPGGVLLVLFAALPVLALLVIGFTRPDGSVGVANFTQVLGSSTYVPLLLKTLLVAFAVTVLSIAIAWPAAWALARYVSPRRRSTVLGLVVIPFITSQLLTIYGFVVLLQAGGPVMWLVSRLGLTSAQASLMYTPTATFVVLVVESLPTAMLVLHSASEQVDGNLLEASRTLGSGRFGTFVRVVWPVCSSMVGVNFALTFVQTVGAFAEPNIVGGPSGQMYGSTIAAQLQQGVNQQFAVALSLVMLLAGLVVVGVVTAALAWQRTHLSGQLKGARP
ncbi:ABC transporter permease [Kineococcus rhizosphaerae]|uniref:Putative spermidine/putrescine transport system permease protein n=1 Tax=Kineococcus rhizosphaerae TaxID=559628 RepID=A0A2T0R278_9ACTN|nr:ABC transporter permease [Kineococcus rhizosphaerae]PRY13613.1 putative spermidine/putrescine transport system permease protein [Kineococcus rhizosphaerae]